MMPLKMLRHIDLSRSQLKERILSSEIVLGGNIKLKIYGTLVCSSGKRMKKQNRVFFKNENEAIQAGYRPCGHCLREKYIAWMSKDQVEKPPMQTQL